MQRTENPNRTRTGRFLALAAGGGVAFVLGSLAGANTAVAPDYLPEATIAEIMNSMVAPFTQTVWDAVVYGDTIEGPDTDEGWQAVRAAAVALAESANVLMIPGRPVAGPGKIAGEGELSPREIAALIEQNRAAWVEHSHALHGAAVQAIHAVDAKEAETLVDVGGRLVEVCEGCHSQFWYPQQ